ncbi:MAG: cation transporter [Pseudomonadota bacterium]
MKTSAIEVQEMLSVFSVDEVEKRIGEVPGVQSVTVNFAAGNATVRYDETQLEATDIKSAVRQRGFDGAAGAAGDGEGKAATGAPPAAAPALPPTGIAPVPPDAPASPAVAGVSPPDKATVPAAPDSLTAESPAAAAGDEPKDKAAPQKS